MSKVSIIVPCYNVEQYVVKCINSIKEQTYDNIEVFLIDDGSTDDTKKIIQKEIKGDKRFKYIYKKNGGLSDARNFGLKKITGEYVCFIDSDDNIDKNYVLYLYNSLIDNHSDISVCYFNRVYKNKIKENKVKMTQAGLINHPAAWNKMYKTDIFKKNSINYLKGYWYEDLNVYLKLILFTNKISLVKESLYNYIQNDKSIMHTYDDRIYNIYEILEDAENYAKKHKKYKKNYSKFEYAYIYHVLIGTIYRACFKEDFSKNTIMKITDVVYNKYPNWYKNEYIKELPTIYQIYLFLLNHKKYMTIFMIMKLIGKKVHL